MPTILAVGRNHQLLITRSAILQTVHADVVEVDAAAAARVLQEKQVDLVVLCHTLTKEEMAEIATLARRKVRAIPVLQLVPARLDAQQLDVDADAVVSV